MAYKTSELKINPDNPRIIKDEKFQKLCKSIKEFPKMLKLRPIVIDGDNIVLGGNMRLKALQELGYKQIPDEWVKRADELTEDERRRFIIEDNVGFGEWDWEALANEWDQQELSDWGLDVPVFEEEKEPDIESLFDFNLPIYKPSEVKCEINELAKLDRTMELISKIDKLKVPNELKEILKIRASFFTDFNFTKIADYYYQQKNEETKEIFRELGMVILAPEEALRRGFIELGKEMIEL